jgi:hypothetical protein
MPLVACLLTWMACAPPQVVREETFETLGRRLIELAERAGPAPLADDARAGGEQRLLARLAVVHDVFELGAIDLWVPARGLDARGEEAQFSRSKAWPHVARLALELQVRWHERLAPADPAARARGREALEALTRWAARVHPTADAPLDEALVAAAAEVRRQWMVEDLRMHVVLAPTRAQFLGLLGASGITVPNNRRLWTEIALRSANSYFMPTALAFALVGGPLSAEDLPLRERELENESLRVYAAHAQSHQLSSLLVPTAPLWFGEGLALYDTVALVGSDETLCAGYGGRKSTSVDDLQTSMGNALMYARIERSPFRSGASRDLFVDELRTARVAGGFRVRDLDTSREGATLSGPFLLERAVLPALVEAGPKGLKEGYAEFFRAYSGAFVAYLAEQRAGERSLLDEALRRLHERRHERSGEQVRLAAVLNELTGKTLGQSMDPEQDLEGAFAHWLGIRR